MISLDEGLIICFLMNLMGLLVTVLFLRKQSD